jgi:hypothetical protein
MLVIGTVPSVPSFKTAAEAVHLFGTNSWNAGVIIGFLYHDRSELIPGDEPHRAFIERVMERKFP